MGPQVWVETAHGCERNGDRNNFADGWWKMYCDFLATSCIPCDGLKGRSSTFAFEIVPDKFLMLSRESSYVYPARLQDGTDAVIRVVSAGETSPELDILQFLSTQEMLSHPDNHILPILRVLFFESWKFAFVVFPRIGDNPCRPWFDYTDEGLDCISQTLQVRTLIFIGTYCLVSQGLAFLHQHLIAHRDIHEGNILIKHKTSCPVGDRPPFRS
ncbi:hypothetical protein BD410DRAFT_299896 [Rickenella mellea]|uniref:Protein kinase domain-containing protein n=1 Tax=Rickenella mellea TaxID=50990 RepID=A0A4Y7Q107_9AGAM|nr:hypothetical protein BD410DRAFT_299896 [Rickenella mellea]